MPEETCQDLVAKMRLLDSKRVPVRLFVQICNNSKAAKKIFMKFVIGEFHETSLTRSRILYTFIAAKNIFSRSCREK
jgi:hypothetical protein